MPEIDLSEFKTNESKVNQSKVNQSKIKESKRIDLSEFKSKSKKEPKSKIRDYAATAIRGATALAPPGPIGFIAGGAGELIGQTIEGRDYNFPSVIAQASLGSIPFGRIGSIGRTALKGGMLGAGGTALAQQTEEGLHVPSGSDLTSIATGAVLGGTTAGIGAKIHKGSKAASKIQEGKSQTVSKSPEIKLPEGQKAEVVSSKRRVRLTKEGEIVDPKTGEILKPQKKERTLHLPGTGKITIDGKHDIITGKRLSTVSSTIESEPSVSNDLSKVIRKEVEKESEEIVRNPGLFRQALNEARQIQTSFDLSFPFRQGIANITRKEFWNSAFPTMIKSISKGGYLKEQQRLVNNPFYDVGQLAGLDITEVGTKRFFKMEEQLRGIYSQKYIRPIEWSNNAYTAFANRLRMDLFASYAKDMKKLGIPMTYVKSDGTRKATDEAMAIAKYINDTTGRGNLGRFEKNAVELNDLLFSPKLIASRINMFRRAFDAMKLAVPKMDLQQGRVLLPEKGIPIDPKVAKMLRKEALRSMTGIGGLALTSIGLSQYAFGKTGTTDPRSTDFGKIKISDKTRLDMTGGFQQYVRIASQIAAGQAMVDGYLQDRNRADTSLRFLRNKLSPLAGAIWNWAAGENVIGEEFKWYKQAAEMIVPLIAQDLFEVYMEDPKVLPYAGTASMFGVGVQSYGKSVGGRKPGTKRSTPNRSVSLR